MGIKDLWPLLEPHCERKPITELRGKTVAIDLAGWVCESLNVVDYAVHAKQHLKILFFRTCYLVWEEVTPVFVLEGAAPILKAQVIAQRNELQFRGVKPRDNEKPTSSQQSTQPKGRTRFNHVLKQCENLLKCMGIQCVQAPGEAEAYAALLNKKNLVDGVISQDSDCFAYGATCVYRHFSVSMQGAQAAAGGAVDLYDMPTICSKMDFGQHKIIVMALLCGCDYCPDGVGGVGREAVIKLFNKYKENEILTRIRKWRQEDSKYSALEMRVDDKSICSNCGHIGRTARHTTSGCAVCRTAFGCDATLWREERLALKAELMLRKKALAYADFPNEQIIAEFLCEPAIPDKLTLTWQQPNLVKFIKQMGHLLQWSEVYCLKKFLPLMTRWQLQNADLLRTNPQLACVQPKKIVKKRTIKTVLSLEIIWQDVGNCLSGLIPAEQYEAYNAEHHGGIVKLWTTVEPWAMVEKCYAEQLAVFVTSREKPKKTTRIRAIKPKIDNPIVCGLIDRFVIKKTPKKLNRKRVLSRPEAVASPLPILLRPYSNDPYNDVEDADFDMSDLINVIVNEERIKLDQHAGKALVYEMDLMVASASASTPQKTSKSTLVTLTSTPTSTPRPTVAKKGKFNKSLDDSFDVIVNQKNRLQEIKERAKHLKSPYNKIKCVNFLQFKDLSAISDDLCDSLSLLDIK